jgi:hypothetical protein
MIQQRNHISDPRETGKYRVDSLQNGHVHSCLSQDTLDRMLCLEALRPQGRKSPLLLTAVVGNFSNIDCVIRHTFGGQTYLIDQ